MVLAINAVAINLITRMSADKNSCTALSTDFSTKDKTQEETKTMRIHLHSEQTNETEWVNAFYNMYIVTTSNATNTNEPN